MCLLLALQMHLALQMYLHLLVFLLLVMYSAGQKDYTLCNPTTPTTFLFAYSNDLASDVVLDTWNVISTHYVSSHLSKYANIRFDVRKENDIQYHNDWRDVNASILSHLPDPSLGFCDSNTGSDVLKIIEKFLDNGQAPICGSEVYIIAKRYPNETKINELIAKLQQQHVGVTVIYSVEPSGGQHPETLYKLATKTNGLCAFDSDDRFSLDVSYETPNHSNLIYAANPIVSRKGNISLAEMTVPTTGDYRFMMTVQDRAPIDNSATVELKWSGMELSSSGSLEVSGGSSPDYYIGNFLSKSENLDQATYSMSLNYEYSDNIVRTLQIRVYGYKQINHWIPYDN